MSDGAAVAVRREMIPTLGIVEMDAAQFDRMKGIATMFAQAGVFKDVREAPVAFAKMVIGRELGLGIPQSMMGIHLIPGGGIQMHYSTILQCVRENGYDYRIVENSAEQCVIKWFQGRASDGDEIGETTFTMDMAKRAEFGKKSGMYDRVPENMLLARAVSNGAKAHVPAAFKGMPVYVPGEFPSSQEQLGEGTGEARGIELPEDVLNVIALAETLGHQGWADRAAWEMRMDRGPESVAATVEEAMGELAELATKQAAEITDAETVDDPSAAPPVDPDVDLPGKEGASSPPEVDVEALRHQLANVQAKVPANQTEADFQKEEIDWVKGELAKAGASYPDEDPGQGSLLP